MLDKVKQLAYNCICRLVVKTTLKKSATYKLLNVKLHWKLYF